MPRGGDKAAGLAPPAARTVRAKLLRGEMSSIPVTFDPGAALEQWQKLSFTHQRRIAAVVEACTRWS